MGARYILDTNIIIYYLKGQMPSNTAAFIEKKLFLENPNLSVITEIELLGWKKASDGQILPDAVIAATALVYDLELITRNVKDFESIVELKTKNPWDLQEE